MRTLNNRIICKPEEAKDKTEGGVYLPDAVREQEARRSRKGIVLFAGPGRTLNDGKFIPIQVSVGDRVLFGKYSGTEIEVDGEELISLTDEDVLMVLDPPQEKWLVPLSSIRREGFLMAKDIMDIFPPADWAALLDRNLTENPALSPAPGGDDSQPSLAISDACSGNATTKVQSEAYVDAGGKVKFTEPVFS